MKRVYFLLSSIFLIASINAIGQSSRWRLVLPAVTYDVAVNPKNYNTIFVGGEGNLIYRSFDGGNTWDTLVIFARMQSSRLNNVLILPNDTNIILVGGLNFGNIVRSTDQGNTWEVVLTKDHAIDLNGKAMLYKLDEPNIIFAGDFKWGVIYRSTNSGATWDSLSKIPTQICSIGLREDSTNIILAGSMYGEIFISQDTGHTWTFCDYLRRPDSMQQDVEITRIEFSPRDPKVGYAVVTYLFALNKNNGGLHRTTDGGYSWDILAFPDTSIWALAVKPRGDKDEIFIGGYTEDFFTLDTTLVPGVGIVRISTDGGETWLNFDDKIDWVVENPGANSDLNTIQSFYDTVFAFGDFGISRLTYNGGIYFFNNNLEDHTNINGLFFFNPKNGYICGDNGYLQRTYNGGFKWFKINTPTQSNLNGIVFIDTTIGIIVGEKSTILRTTDAGKNWIDLGIDYYCDFNGIVVHNNTLYAYGTNGTILISTDFGNSWSKVPLIINDNITSISFKSNKTIFITTSNGKIYSSTNFPDLELLYYNESFKFNKIKFANDSIGFVATNKFYHLRTTDGGNNWQIRKNLSYRYINDIEITGDTVYFVGQCSIILRSTDLGETWTAPSGGPGPRANVWRAYYYENNGVETLFMATEAGLFALDYPLTAKEIKENENGNFRIHLLPGKYSFFVNYKLVNQDTKTLNFNIYNLLGQKIFSTQIHPFGDSFRDFIILPFTIKPGIYLIQIVEGQTSHTKKLVVD